VRKQSHILAYQSTSRSGNRLSEETHNSIVTRSSHGTCEVNKKGKVVPVL